MGLRICTKDDGLRLPNRLMVVGLDHGAHDVRGRKKFKRTVKALPRILLDDKKKKGENYILHFTKQESTKDNYLICKVEGSLSPFVFILVFLYTSMLFGHSNVSGYMYWYL